VEASPARVYFQAARDMSITRPRHPVYTAPAVTTPRGPEGLCNQARSYYEPAPRPITRPPGLTINIPPA